jgi:hypothetical protein
LAPAAARGVALLLLLLLLLLTACMGATASGAFDAF